MAAMMERLAIIPAARMRIESHLISKTMRVLSMCCAIDFLSVRGTKGSMRPISYLYARGAQSAC